MGTPPWVWQSQQNLKFCGKSAILCKDTGMAQEILNCSQSCQSAFNHIVQIKVVKVMTTSLKTVAQKSGVFTASTATEWRGLITHYNVTDSTNEEGNRSSFEASKAHWLSYFRDCVLRLSMAAMMEKSIYLHHTSILTFKDKTAWDRRDQDASDIRHHLQGKRVKHSEICLS